MAQTRSPFCQLIVKLGSAAIRRVLQTFESIFHALRRGYTVENVISSGLGFGEILGSIMFANELYHPDLENDANRRIDATIEHMLANIQASITLSDLAKRAVLSVTRYSQLFKKKTGYSPIEYFSRLKIQHACHLLDATEWKIYAISQKVGYADPYYFSRVFHKIMGLSPLQYRRRGQRPDAIDRSITAPPRPGV